MKFSLARFLLVATIPLSGCSGELTGVEMLGLDTQGAAFGAYRASVRQMGDDVLVTDVTYQTPKQIADARQGRANYLAKTGFAITTPLLLSSEAIYQFNCVSRSYQVMLITGNLENGERESDMSFFSPEDLRGTVLPNTPRERVFDYACLPYWRRLLQSLKR